MTAKRDCEDGCSPSVFASGGSKAPEGERAYEDGVPPWHDGGGRESLEGPRFELAIGDEAYPPALADIPDPPERIFGIGNPSALEVGVAIIGSRKATPYGLTCTERFAELVAARGLTIIAGGAVGCDLAAHKRAVDLGTPTVVVFGSGADVTYPRRGRDVFQRAIDQGGAVISENPWGTHPLPRYFPKRNRIIAGLAALLVIVEAGYPSGTMTTADAALEQGKEVAVVPGAITSPASVGSNRLLAQGATPLFDEDSLDDALASAFQRHPFCLPQAQGGGDASRTGFSPVPDDVLASDDVLSALAAQPLRADELAEHFDFSASELAARLAAYEMDGLVERDRAGMYHVRALVRGRS